MKPDERDAKGHDMSDAELSALLWKERELLDTLAFKLETQHLMLAGGRSHWLGRASNEIHALTQALGELELERDLAIHALDDERGTGIGSSLADIVDAAPEQWRDVYRDHRVALTRLTGQVDQLRQANEQLLRAGIHGTTAALADLRTPATTYDGTGHPAAARTAARLFQQDA